MVLETWDLTSWLVVKSAFYSLLIQNWKIREGTPNPKFVMVERASDWKDATDSNLRLDKEMCRSS